METLLLISLFFCHFLADYTHLSTAWMLGAKRLGRPIIPILAHASVHAFLMMLVLWFFLDHNQGYLLLKLVLFQLLTHFTIDLWKGRMNAWFPSLQSPANKWHWIVFGADQFFHAVIIILMVHKVYP